MRSVPRAKRSAYASLATGLTCFIIVVIYPALIAAPDSSLQLLPDASATYELLPTVPGELTGVNDVGSMVSVATPSLANSFRIDGTTATPFSVPGHAYTIAYDINNTGQIVGCSYEKDFSSNARGFLTLNLVDFVTLLVPNSQATCAFAINDHGHIVGEYTMADGSTHGFVYDGLTWQTIDYPGEGGTVVYGINNSGTIIGSAGNLISPDGPLTGFIRSASGVFATIAVPGASAVFPWRINGAGQIIGGVTGRDASGSFFQTNFLKTGDKLESLHYPGQTFALLKDITTHGQVVAVYFTGSPPVPSNFIATPKPVCEVQIADLTVERAKRSTMRAAITKLEPFTLDRVEWQFFGDTRIFSTKVTKSPSTPVILVDDRTHYSVVVTVFAGRNQPACTAGGRVFVESRGGPTWELKTNGRLAKNWDSVPLVSGTTYLGRTCSPTTGACTAEIFSPYVPGLLRWDDDALGGANKGGFSVKQVNDPNGPNDGYWYVSGAKLHVNYVSQVSKWIRPGAAPPPGAAAGTKNFYQQNRDVCRVDMTAFLRAVENHEWRGSGPGSTGHWGIIEEAARVTNVKAMIETMWEPLSEEARGKLILRANQAIFDVSKQIQSLNDERFLIGNWPGGTPWSQWDATGLTWSDCKLDRPF